MCCGDERLRRQKEIKQLFKEGAVYHGRLVVLILRRAEEGPRKVLFVASRRVGNAVQRNRAKRLMREAYRQIAAHLTTKHGQLAWLARGRCAAASMAETRADMITLLSHAGWWGQTAQLP